MIRHNVCIYVYTFVFFFYSAYGSWFSYSQKKIKLFKEITKLCYLNQFNNQNLICINIGILIYSILKPCLHLGKLFEGPETNSNNTFEIFAEYLPFLEYRSSHQRCSIKKVFLKILQNSQENTCARVSFLIKLQPQTASESNGVMKHFWTLQTLYMFLWVQLFTFCS